MPPFCEFVIMITDGFDRYGHSRRSFLKKSHKDRKILSRRQNGEIIIEVGDKMCLTGQNISDILARHFPGTGVESELSSFFGDTLYSFDKNIGLFMEKFTITITDRGVVVIGENGTRMEFSAGEALMFLDILKNEEVELRKMADSASPMSLNINGLG